MRIQYFLLILIVLSGSYGYSQQVIGEITSDFNKKDFQIIPAGDSLLIKYNEVSRQGSQLRVKWISSEGQVSSLFTRAPIFAVAKSEGKLYYYYIDDKSGGVRALTGQPGDSTLKKSVKIIPIEGTVMSAFVDTRLTFLLLSKNRKQITVLEVDGMTVVAARKYTLPIPFSKLASRNALIESFDEQSPLNAFKGYAPVKIFRYGSEFYISIDQKRYEDTMVQPGITHILSLREDATVDYRKINLSAPVNFGSYILDGKLFRSTVSSEVFTLSVYDIMSTQNEFNKVILLDQVMKASDAAKVTRREGRENVVYEDTFERMMKFTYTSDSYLVVHRNGEGYKVQWGTYYNDKGTGIMASNSLLIGVVTFAVTTAMRQAMEGPGISQYLYHDIDLENDTFSLDVVANSTLKKRIDAYEIKHTWNRNYDYKGYAPFKNGVLATYYLKDTRSIQFVYFE